MLGCSHVAGLVFCAILDIFAQMYICRIHEIVSHYYDNGTAMCRVCVVQA